MRDARGATGAERCVALTITAVCALVMTAIGAPDAAAQSVDQCIATKVADGVARPEAVAVCIAKDKSPTTLAPASRPTSPLDRTGHGDGGTSAGALALSVTVGAVGGAGALALFGRRRRRGNGPGAAPTTSSAPSAPASSFPAPVPPGGGAPSPDRSHALIDALIDLSDRVPSAALRSEILVALENAGVRHLDIAPGLRFDVTSMRGVGSVLTDDPSVVGFVASTERVGFVDGTRIIRLPDVTVHRAD